MIRSRLAGEPGRRRGPGGAGYIGYAGRAGGSRNARRILPLALAALTAVATACSGGGDSPGPSESLLPTVRTATAGVDDVEGARASEACLAKVKTLRVSAVGEVNDAAKSGKDYMERTHPGLTVELTSTAPNYVALVQQISADQAAGRAVDVAVAGFDVLPTFARALGAQELSPRLLRASYDQRFVPLAKVDGKQVGIPQQVSVPVLAYNLDILGKAGVDPATLTTTTGVLAAAEKIKAFDPDIVPIDLPTGQQFGQWFLNTLASSKGAPIQAGDGSPALTTPQAREAAEFLAKVGSYGSQSNDPTTEGLIRFGIHKDSAMVGATIAAVASGSEAIARRGADGFRVGVAPFPTLPGGSLKPVAGGNALTVLSTDPCQKEVAVEFLVSVLAPDVVAASTESYSYIPVDTAALAQLEGFYREHPQLKQFNELVPDLVAPPIWGGARGGEVPKLLSDQVARIMAGEDVPATLGTAQTEAGNLVR